MTQGEHDRCIDYIEFPALQIDATKDFYAAAFGWTFTDYGPDYTSFEDGRLAGGFTTATPVTDNGVLIVIYVGDLEAMRARVIDNGGSISKEIFAFPGGRRFHFRDPNGNQLAVWSE